MLSWLLTLTLLIGLMTAVSVGAETTTLVNLTFTLDEGETAETEADRALMKEQSVATEDYSEDGGYEGGAVTYTALADPPVNAQTGKQVLQNSPICCIYPKKS